MTATSNACRRQASLSCLSSSTMQTEWPTFSSMILRVRVREGYCPAQRIVAILLFRLFRLLISQLSKDSNRTDTPNNAYFENPDAGESIHWFEYRVKKRWDDIDGWALTAETPDSAGPSSFCQADQSLLEITHL